MTDLTHGMNIDAVRHAAGQLAQQSAVLHELTGRIDGVLGSLGQNWSGADFHQFREWWTTQHRPALQNLADKVGGLAQSARHNADEQNCASGGDAGSSGQAVGSAGGGVPGATPIANGSSVGAAAGSLDGSRRDAKTIARLFSGRDRDSSDGLQCTDWADFRWRELGATSVAFANGGAMARSNGGSESISPLLGAMASYGQGTRENPGHVMIVEEILAGGNKARVSEANVGSNPLFGGSSEFRFTREIVKRGGFWYYDSWSGPQRLTIANHPSVR